MQEAGWFVLHDMQISNSIFMMKLGHIKNYTRFFLISDKILAYIYLLGHLSFPLLVDI